MVFEAAKAIKPLHSSRASGAKGVTIFDALSIEAVSLTSASLASVSSSQVHCAATPSDAGNIDFSEGSGIFGLFFGFILAFCALNTGASSS